MYACMCMFVYVYVLVQLIHSMVPFTVRQGGRELQKLSGQQRANIILRLASLLREKEDEILAANKTDIALAQDTLSPSLLSRLRLSSAKLQTLANGITAIAEVSL